MRLSLLASFLGLAFAGACTTDTGTAAQSLACYDTANGVVCKQATGSKESVDVDGDGRRDAYVCGDTTSASDSVSDSNGDDPTSGGDDDGGDDDGGTDDGATLAMSDSDDADSDSTSNADCASHDSASDDPSQSDSTVDSADSAGDDSVSDGDDDGTADGDDCDCVPPPPGTPA
jgi:hypothetical protein